MPMGTGRFSHLERSTPWFRQPCACGQVPHESGCPAEPMEYWPEGNPYTFDKFRPQGPGLLAMFWAWLVETVTGRASGR